jgi:hypothetical protein
LSLAIAWLFTVDASGRGEAGGGFPFLPLLPLAQSPFQRSLIRAADST